MRDGERTAVILNRHPLWLEGLERLLERIGVTVVGATAVPERALALLEQERPSLFIAEHDSSEPSDMLETVRRASMTNPSVKSIVLSALEDDASIDAAFDAGASIYCVKTAEAEDLAAAIRQAFKSSIYFARERRRRVAPVATAADSPAPVDLTKREREILVLVAEGYSNSQLARMLWVTEQTVKFHLSNIYRKAGVANRTEASRWAQLNGLLAPADRAASTAA